MTNVVTTPTGSGYNATVINSNIEKLRDGINNEPLHRRGGNNKMLQHLDMNGFTLYNIGVDPTNSSSVVTQEQFEDLVAQITAEVAANIGFVVDGDVIVGAGNTLGTAAFEDIQTGYYSPGEFDTAEKHVLVNGSFGLGAFLAENGQFTGNLNSVDFNTGLPNTQIRYVTGLATNLPRDDQPGYVINLTKDTGKSAQVFVSEGGEGTNEGAWDVEALQDAGSLLYGGSSGNIRCATWDPDGMGFTAGLSNHEHSVGSGTSKTVIAKFTVSDPFDIESAVLSTVTDYSAVFETLSTNGMNINCIQYNDDGTKLFTITDQNAPDDRIYEVTLTTPYDPSSISSYTARMLPGITSGHFAFTFSAEGTLLYLVVSSSGSSEVRQYSLASPYNLVGLSFVGTRIFSSAILYGIAINPDGSELVLIRRNNDVQGSLITSNIFSTPHVISTLSTSANGSEFVDYAAEPFMTLAGDGTHMIVARNNGNIPTFGLRGYSLGLAETLLPGIFYRTRDGNAWEEWKRLITDKDPANIKSTFTVGGNIDIPIVAGVATIDCSLGNSFNLEVTEDVLVTFINEPEVGDDYTCKVKLVNGGSQVIDLDSAIAVPSGAWPPLQASGIDMAVITFNGTDIFGCIAMQDLS